jgi:hypothetical protein
VNLILSLPREAKALLSAGGLLSGDNLIPQFDRQDWNDFFMEVSRVYPPTQSLFILFDRHPHY